MKNGLLVIIMLFACIFKSPAQFQGINNLWLMGYESYDGIPFGQTKMDFFTGPPSISYDSLQMDFNHTFSDICDTNGDLLFYTNGFYIADATHDTMLNGSGINPSSYTTYCSQGLATPQANIIIKLPNSNNLFYLIHSTLDQYPGYTCSNYLYLSIIDMNLNGGLGAVTNTKNFILLNDSMNPGKINACKHANGRDWWIMCHRLNSNKFYTFLLTPYGISGPYSQNIGIIRNFDGGQAVFSQDGSRYAYYHILGGLEIFDFDRCTGNLSNPVFISIPYNGGYNVGMAISANSNVLYVPNVNNVIQFDLTSPNISASQQVVAVYDSFTSGYPGWGYFQTVFGLAALAPDGKIYITTGNSTLHMHVINQPDSIGAICNLVQHGVQLPAYYFNTLPNHPNYFLGKITGGPCDTVPINNSIEEMPPRILKVMPNPTTGIFTLWFTVHEKPGWVEVYDSNGLCVRKEAVAQWSQYKRIDLTGKAEGVYLCRMRWGVKETNVKIMKE